MLNKEICRKCWLRLEQEGYLSLSLNADNAFEARWECNLIWCAACLQHLWISRRCNTKNKAFSVINGNLNIFDPIPEKCPYFLEHTVSQ
jgi:hypothetical protein